MRCITENWSGGYKQANKQTNKQSNNHPPPKKKNQYKTILPFPSPPKKERNKQKQK
jgi:hypothetical protein